MVGDIQGRRQNRGVRASQELWEHIAELPGLGLHKWGQCQRNVGPIHRRLGEQKVDSKLDRRRMTARKQNLQQTTLASLQPQSMQFVIENCHLLHEH